MLLRILWFMTVFFCMSCRSTNMRGALGVNGLRSPALSTTCLSILSYLSQSTATSAPKSSWQFFRIDKSFVAGINASTGHSIGFEVANSPTSVQWLAHPETGKDWFLNIGSVDEQQASGKIEVWHTTKRTTASQWGSLPTHKLVTSEGIAPEQRQRLLNLTIKELQQFKYDFSPLSPAAVLTRLRKFIRELSEATSEDAVLSKELKETERFIAAGDAHGLWPLPVTSAWQDESGRVRLAMITNSGQEYLSSWQEQHAASQQFVSHDGVAFTQMPVPLSQIRDLKVDDSALEFSCNGVTTTLTRTNAKQRYDLVKAIKDKDVTLTFADANTIQWLAYRAYRFDDNDGFMLLEESHGSKAFDAKTGRVTLTSQSTAKERHVVTRYYKIDPGHRTFAVEFGATQTLLLHDDDQTAALMYWNDGGLAERHAQRIPLATYFATMDLTPPAPKGWCPSLTVAGD